MEYRVKLPDHDWVVGSRHKLIPSVYAIITVNKNGGGETDAVTYSGPTFIAIRSGKHGGTSAQTHAADLDFMISNEAISKFLMPTGIIKPIMIQIVDGGPDENPR